MENHPGRYQALIELNEKHPIYQGHFPGMPVTPGVCLVQMVKEITSKILEKKLMMHKADQIKFMAIVNPFVNKELTLEITIKPLENEQWHCDSLAFHENIVFFKLKSNYHAIG